MSTIIAHGKKQWGRGDKNKRVDEELEAELAAEIESLGPIPKSKMTEGAISASELTNDLNSDEIEIKNDSNKRSIISHNKNDSEYMDAFEKKKLEIMKAKKKNSVRQNKVKNGKVIEHNHPKSSKG